MPRWLVAFILAIVLPGYGLAALGQPMTATQDGPGAHALVSGDAHPTHEDGSSWGGGCGDEPAQVHVDNLLDIPELFDAPRCPALPATASAQPRRLGPSAFAPPFLEGLRRPPRGAEALS